MVSEVYFERYKVWNFKIITSLEGMCDLTNTIKPPLFSVISSIYGLIMLVYELITGEKIHWISFLLHTKYQYFHLLFYLNHQIFLAELIFRCEKITLLRWECRNCFKVISSYSWVAIDASIRDPFTCLTCFVLDHTFFKELKTFFAKIPT